MTLQAPPAPRWWFHVAMGLVCAVLTAVAFPPIGIWVAALLAPMPLYFASARAGARPGRAGLLVALGVLPLWVYEERWLIDVAGLWYVLLAAYMSCYAWAQVWLVARLCDGEGRWRRWLLRPLVFAVAWTGLEVVRGEVIWDGYAWFLAGHPMMDAGMELSSAALALGAYFVSFCLVMVAAGLGQAMIGRGRARLVGLGLAACALVVWVGVGYEARRAVARDRKPATVRVAVIQSNVPQNNKESPRVKDQIDSFGRWLELARKAAGEHPDLIVWPETMFPGISLDPESVKVERGAHLTYKVEGDAQPMVTTTFHDRLLALQQELGVPMVVGALAYEGFSITTGEDGRLKFNHRAKYNSAFLIREGKVDPARYDKLELMAFGETVPHLSHWAWAKKLTSALSGTGWVFDLDFGSREQVFELDLLAREGREARRVAFITPICFEGSMSRVVRRLVNARSASGMAPEFIVSMTNDGWFGRFPGGREQHLMTMRWRAIETELAVARAANTGVSTFVDSSGALLHKDDRDQTPIMLASGQEGFLVADLPLPPAGGVRKLGWGAAPPFLMLGNTFGWLCTILTGFGLVAVLFDSRGRLGAMIRKRFGRNEA